MIPADLLHTVAYRRDPTGAWRLLRHEAPIWHDPIDDRWVVTRYDDVLAVFRDSETYGVERPYHRFSEQIGPTLVNLDGPAHRQRRAIVAPELVGRRIERIRPLIATRVAELFRAWPRSGTNSSPPDRPVATRSAEAESLAWSARCVDPFPGEPLDA